MAALESANASALVINMSTIHGNNLQEKTNCKETVLKARIAFNTNITKSLKFRKEQLKALLQLYTEHEDDMFAALAKDLNKSKHEASLFEIEFLKNDLLNVIANFERWAKPENRYKRIMNTLDDLKLYKDPYGVVLIIGAWNYPLQSTLLPVASAIAAGNCIIIQPNHLASHSAQFILEMIPKYLNQDCYPVISDDDAQFLMLLEERFDYIFYTGQMQYAKLIHQAAAAHLTPTTFVLGGKNPVYLHEDADIEVAAKRILWGKCMNAGQTCIGPEYLLCTRQTQERFLSVAPRIIEEFYGRDPKQSADFVRIINDTHFNRAVKLMKNHQIAVGGYNDPVTRFIHPTILIDVKANDPIMDEEIYAPILPIININNVEDAIQLINAREKALALYIFSKNNSIIKQILTHTSSGGVTVNDTLMHIAAESLPFGGVGNSGFGNYHGKAGFDTFVHEKSVLVKPMNALVERVESIRYPPYNDTHLFIIKQVMAKTICPFSFILSYFPHICMFILGAIVTFLIIITLH